MIGLFITRAQPGLHYGQIDGILQGLQQGAQKIIIGVGSSNKEYTRDNPFTYKERIDMIKRSCIEVLTNTDIEIYPIPDFGDNDKWKNYIYKNLPKFDMVLSGNIWVTDIFKNDKKIIDLKINKNIKGTTIRNQIALGLSSELNKSLPNSVIEYLSSIGAQNRLKEIFKNNFMTPNLTVDIIFKDNEGKYIFIQRKNYPYGLAFPGGFVDYGEDPINAVIRETKEETSANISVSKLIGVYGNPSRDPRGHNISIVYEGKYIDGSIIASDDAKSIVKLTQEAALARDDFAFDHKKIFEDYISKQPK